MVATTKLLTTYVEDSETCNPEEAGTVISTATNANGCDYQITTITTYVGSEDL
jgi:hypothetical protein